MPMSIEKPMLLAANAICVWIGVDTLLEAQDVWSVSLALFFVNGGVGMWVTAANIASVQSERAMFIVIAAVVGGFANILILAFGVVYFAVVEGGTHRSTALLSMGFGAFNLFYLARLTPELKALAKQD